MASNCGNDVNVVDETNRPSTSELGDATETSDANGSSSTSSGGSVNSKSLLKRRSSSSGVANPAITSRDDTGETSSGGFTSPVAAEPHSPANRQQSVAFAMLNEEAPPEEREDSERRPEDGQEDVLPHLLKNGGSVSVVSEESSIFAPSSTASSMCALTAYRPKVRTVVAVADFADKKDLSSRMEFGGDAPNTHNNHGQGWTSPNCRSGSPQRKRVHPFFGGAISDIRNRFPQYKSDIYDAANFQCLTSVVFMFFAAFAPAITFGGLMGKYTNEKIGTIETLLAQCICGVLWGLFAAQPLMIMSATGPVLIFEASLYTFCENLHLDFMTVRFYTGVWIFTIAVLIAALDGSRLLAYVTRFTEDIFATLISAIFIAESLHFVWHTFKENPVEDYQYYLRIHTNCQNATFIATNSVAASAMMALANSYAMGGGGGAAAGIDGIIPLPPASAPLPLPFDVDNVGDAARNVNDTAVAANRFAVALAEAKRQMVVGQQQMRGGRRCGDAEPNTALLTAIIMFSTFALAFCLKKLRESFYLGRKLRRAIGDFGVLISIVAVALGAHAFIPDPYLQRLDMPDTISFTNRERRGHGLFIDAQLNEHSWYGVFVALFAAMLIFILLFVETEITELLLMRRERGCRKGSGMNWDLVLMGACALLCSVFGLPWMCAAAVQSLAHCSSLTVMKKKAAGQPPEVDHVIEQRVTTIGVSLLIGLIAFAGSYLRLPLASLFGVFLYLGVMNLSGVQLIQRSVLFLIPEKYFPVTPYTQEMGIFRMHLYTWIQLCCLFVVYVVKYFKRTALAFPFVLMLFIVIRHTLLPKIFTEKELRAVDGDSDEDDETWMDKDFYEHSRIPV